MFSTFLPFRILPDWWATATLNAPSYSFLTMQTGVLYVFDLLGFCICTWGKVWSDQLPPWSWCPIHVVKHVIQGGEYSLLISTLTWILFWVGNLKFLKYTIYKNKNINFYVYVYYTFPHFKSETSRWWQSSA